MTVAMQILMIEEDTPLLILPEQDEIIAKDGTFVYASTVAFSETIYLRHIPRFAFYMAENNVEEILTHESLHLAMYALGLFEASEKFDKLFPRIGDFPR